MKKPSLRNELVGPACVWPMPMGKYHPVEMVIKPNAYRNTKNITQDFLEECAAHNVKPVPFETFNAVLAAQVVEERTNGHFVSRIEMLEVLEDMHHGYVLDNQHYLNESYLAYYGIPVRTL